MTAPAGAVAALFSVRAVDQARPDGILLKLVGGGTVFLTLEQAVVVGEAARAQADLTRLRLVDPTSTGAAAL